MNQKKIDDMIPFALHLLSEMPIDKKGMKAGNYEISKVYFGYIAAFGPSVVQSGIAKTLAFYSREKGEGEGDRKLILEFIKKVFIMAYTGYNSYSAKDLLELYDDETKKPDFLTLQKLDLADKILEAAIACKLVMNTYHAKEKTASEEE
jgi:CRISPR/Cas system CMR-associated protein Cmr5 small subunit